MSIKILFGTKNPAKLEVMSNRLKPLGIELMGLNDLEREIPEVEEDGKTPLENARKKALAYFEAFKMAVFSCDSGLYIDELPDELQPGCKVRRVNGKTLKDDEMIEYYTMLAEKYGTCQAYSRGEAGETEPLHPHLLTARYKNAICFVKDENTIYESMDKTIESEPFFITSKPYGYIRKEGFPIDSISVHINTGKYYYDMDKSELEQFAVEDGVLAFFRNNYSKQLMEV